jgi:hypothetical protein
MIGQLGSPKQLKALQSQSKSWAQKQGLPLLPSSCEGSFALMPCVGSAKTLRITKAAIKQARLRDKKMHIFFMTRPPQF